MIDAFITGVILAFGLIIPLGVQNIFIFNQGASQSHFYSALPSVLTAAVCDTILITLAVLGVSLAVLEVAWLKTAIFAVGCIFLLYMGTVAWRSAVNTSQLSEPPKPLSAMRQIIFAASVSIFNPHAILDTVGVIGTNSLDFDGLEKLGYTLGCICVSIIWFFGLALAGRTMHRLDSSGKGLLILNKISALIIWGVAIYLAFQIYQDLQAVNFDLQKLLIPTPQNT
jgi:L-lysine exporter family protein LysE/ArgO